MLIIVVKDVGKLPLSRASTQTQWHSNQPNSIPTNQRKHPSDEKPVSLLFYTDSFDYATCVMHSGL